MLCSSFFVRTRHNFGNGDCNTPFHTLVFSLYVWVTFFLAVPVLYKAQELYRLSAGAANDKGAGEANVLLSAAGFCSRVASCQ